MKLVEETDIETLKLSLDCKHYASYEVEEYEIEDETYQQIILVTNGS